MTKLTEQIAERLAAAVPLMRQDVETRAYLRRQYAEYLTAELAPLIEAAERQHFDHEETDCPATNDLCAKCALRTALDGLKGK